jgi:aspartate kinase
MLLTVKFGGTSVQDAGRIRHAATLVKGLVGRGHRVVVVTSAMSGVTNQLVSLLGQPAPPTAGEDARMAEYFRFTNALEQQHLQTAREAIRDAKLVEEVRNALRTERSGLDRILVGSHLLGELTPIGYDFIVSAGERLCMPILANCLRDQGVDAIGLGGDEAGILTDNNYGNALPDEPGTREAARRALLPRLEAGQVPVVAGFYGRSPQRRLAILGRGGSDFTATLLGCSLDADEIWLLKHEVDGIKSTDPRLVPAAYTLAELPYEIAAEMALLGAKVLHPRSVQPAARQHIPLRIGTSADAEKPGTRLVPLRPGSAGGVAALTLVRGGALVQASAAEMGDEGIVPAGLPEALRRQNIDVLSSAAGFNSGRALWLVGNVDRDRFVTVLQQQLGPGVHAQVQRDVAVLGVVGEQVGRAAGVLARVLHCLDGAGAPPLAVIQGASPHSIAVALADDAQRLPAAMRSLHTELGLDRAAR